MVRNARSAIARDRIVALEPRLLLAAVPVWAADQPGIGQPAQVATASPFSLQEIHAITGVDVAHEHGLTGSGQTVVVIDSGIAYDHAALGGGLGFEYRVVGGWDFTEEADADPYDDGPAGFHGTHVAGIIGSSDATHQGVAPDVDMVALRVFNDLGRGRLSWLEQSLQWVIEHVNDFEYPVTTVNLSLGTDWNSTTLPTYATLEDEFSTLRRMGVFVAVAAGNSFDPQEEGLSYPAASPHVIPAASETIEGGVSDFSQRTARVLVAPGEQITSTVPDYVHDFNGITDDFYAASGTSMASPYLAGASVLVRQAMERAGIQRITVDAIEDVLVGTAKEIFDPVSNATYHALDVAAAVESLLTPHVIDVGELSDLGTSLTVPPSPSASVLRFTPEFAGLWSIEADPTETFHVVGSRVDHTFLGSAVISTDQAESIRIEFASGEATRAVRLSQVVAVRGSRVTVRGTAGVDRITVDDRGQIEFNGIEFAYAVEQISRVSVDGAQGDDQLVVMSSADAAMFDFSPGYVHVVQHELAITGFDFDSIEVFADGQGNNASFHGSSFSDQYFAKPTHSWMKNDGYLNYVRGAETVTAWSANSVDKAVFYDSDTADSRSAHAERVQVIGVGYDNRAVGFAEVLVYADADGQRVARLDSPDSQQVQETSVRPEFVTDVGYVTDNSSKDPAAVQQSLSHGKAMAGVLFVDPQRVVADRIDHQLRTAGEDLAERAIRRGYGLTEFARVIALEAAPASPVDTAWSTVARDERDSEELGMAPELLDLEQVIADIAVNDDLPE